MLKSADFFSKRFLLSCKLTLLAVILAGFLYLIDWPELLKSFTHLTWSLAIILILISFILVGISSLKWQLFLRANGQVVSWIKLFKLYLVGYFANSFLPSFVGGDLWRSYLVNGKKEMGASFAATFMERFTGFLAMALLAILFLPLVPTVSSEINLIVLLISLIIIASILVIYFRLVSRFQKYLPNKISAKVLKMEEDIHKLLFQKKLFIQAIVISLIFHSITVLNVYYAALAVGWVDIPILQVYIVLPLILLISALPLTPSGLGVTEGAFVFFLQALGATPEEGLAIALIFRLKVYLLGIIGISWLGIQK